MTIKHIHQLEAEKKRIAGRQAQLELTIREEWAALKRSLHPANMVADAAASFLRRKNNEAADKSGLLQEALVYGITLLAGKLMSRRKKPGAKKHGD